MTGANQQGIGTARYQRFVPVDDDAATLVRKRTVTRLYNESPAWLMDLHRQLDEAVAEAYGWNPAMSDSDMVSAVLSLNLLRARP